MSFRIFSTRVSVTVPFCAAVAFLLCIDRSGLMLISLLSSALHEMGHLAAMRAFHTAPREMCFGFCGITIVGAPSASVKEEFLTALAGPAANLAAAAVLAAGYSFLGIKPLFYACLINAAVAVFNLFPVERLDGGTVFSVIFSKLFGAARGAVILSVFSAVFAGAVTVAGVTAAFSGVRNPSLLLMGIYLLVMNIMKV